MKLDLYDDFLVTIKVPFFFLQIYVIKIHLQNLKFEEKRKGSTLVLVKNTSWKLGLIALFS